MINRKSQIRFLRQRNPPNRQIRPRLTLLNSSPIKNGSRNNLQNPNPLKILNKILKSHPKNAIIPLHNPQPLPILITPTLRIIPKIPIPLKFPPRIPNLQNPPRHPPPINNIPHIQNSISMSRDKPLITLLLHNLSTMSKTSKHKLLSISLLNLRPNIIQILILLNPLIRSPSKIPQRMNRIPSNNFPITPISLRIGLFQQNNPKFFIISFRKS